MPWDPTTTAVEEGLQTYPAVACQESKKYTTVIYSHFHTLLTFYNAIVAITNTITVVYVSIIVIT